MYMCTLEFIGTTSSSLQKLDLFLLYERLCTYMNMDSKIQNIVFKQILPQNSHNAPIKNNLCKFYFIFSKPFCISMMMPHVFLLKSFWASHQSFPELNGFKMDRVSGIREIISQNYKTITFVSICYPRHYFMQLRVAYICSPASYFPVKSNSVRFG